LTGDSPRGFLVRYSFPGRVVFPQGFLGLSVFSGGRRDYQVSLGVGHGITLLFVLGICRFLRAWSS
jgi:hypothetical protein